MNLLLDTHAILWTQDAPANLSPIAQALLKDPANTLLVSAVSFWEIAVKVSIGKLKLSKPFDIFGMQALVGLPAVILQMDINHGKILSQLPLHHRDPFDRMLVAQALVEQIPLVSADPHLDVYGIDRRW